MNQNFCRIVNGMLGKNGSAIWIVLMQEGTNSMGIIFSKICMVFVMFYLISPTFSVGLIYFTEVQLFILISTHHSCLLSYIKYLYRRLWLILESFVLTQITLTKRPGWLSIGNKYGYRTLEGLKKTMKGVIMVDGHWAKIHMEYKAQVQTAWISNSKKKIFFYNFSKDFI